MSARAHRAATQAVVLPYAWQRTGATASVPLAALAPQLPSGLVFPPSTDVAPATVQANEARIATLEREAFAKGFAQGERAGAEAAAVQGEAMLRRLTQTLEEVTHLRAQMIRDTEHQMVRLALAVARRIIHKEVSIDRDLLMAIARVAMDRIGDGAQVTIRLNADDYAAMTAARNAPWLEGHVTVVADARVPRGGCRIESDLGMVDAGVDAQLQEITQALLQDAPATVNAKR
jgi:flagellar assembly protein FliH